MKCRRGFTLIEILIVVVIIGILAAITIPKFANSRDRAVVAQMKSDLRNLATAEEAFFYDSAKYTTNFTLMNKFEPSVGITVTIPEATAQGWSAQASASSTYHTCALFAGNASPVSPATIEGQITCQ